VTIAGSDFSVLPLTHPSATDDNHIFAWHIDNIGQRKRYVLPVITVGNGATGAYATVIAVLSRAHSMPYTATGRGLTQEAFL
jgi:hypothetical protein